MQLLLCSLSAVFCICQIVQGRSRTGLRVMAGFIDVQRAVDLGGHNVMPHLCMLRCGEVTLRFLISLNKMLFATKTNLCLQTSSPSIGHFGFLVKVKPLFIDKLYKVLKRSCNFHQINFTFRSSCFPFPGK